MLYEPVRIAVIGAGGYSFQLIKRIMSVPDSGIVVAVTSRDLNSAGAKYCRERGMRVYATVDELLEAGGFEAVVNPAPIHLHAPLTKQCMDAGYPVLMEKPPVATVQELDDLIAASEAAKQPVAVCFNSLFGYNIQQIKRELLAGRFGKIQRIKGIGAWVRTDAYFNRNSWAGKVYSDGHWIIDGDLNNPLAHVVCGCLFFGGAEQNALAEPVSVEAELYRCNPIETEDTSCVRVQTQEGIEIMTWLSLAAEVEINPRIVVEAELATISYDNFKDLTITFKDGTVERHEAYQEDRIEMIVHLCHALRTGKRFRCDLESVRPFTVVVNGAFDSAGCISSVSPEFVDTVPAGEATQTTIAELHDIMLRAFDAEKLYSELDVPWAKAGVVIDTRYYTQFPTRFAMVPIETEVVPL